METKSTEAVRTENFDIDHPALTLSCVDSDISIVESEDGRTFVDFYAESEHQRESIANSQLAADASTVTDERHKKRRGLEKLLNSIGRGVSIAPRKRHFTKFLAARSK